jgi:hypothetical protein
MCIVAKRRGLCLFTLAKTYFLGFVKKYFHTAERRPFHLFMVAVAERLASSEAATAPGIDFAGLNHDTHGFTAGCFGKTFGGD